MLEKLFERFNEDNSYAAEISTTYVRYFHEDLLSVLAEPGQDVLEEVRRIGSELEAEGILTKVKHNFYMLNPLAEMQYRLYQETRVEDKLKEWQQYIRSLIKYP
jgi:hypothetical protein